MSTDVKWSTFWDIIDNGPDRQSGGGWLYVILWTDGTIKVGSTVNARQRMSQYIADSKAKIALIFGPEFRKVEKAFHKAIRPFAYAKGLHHLVEYYTLTKKDGALRDAVMNWILAGAPEHLLRPIREIALEYSQNYEYAHR